MMQTGDGGAVEEGAAAAAELSPPPPAPPAATTAAATAAEETEEEEQDVTLQALTGVARETMGQLCRVWNEVGFSPEERTEQMQAFLGDFREMCALKVREEQEILVQLRQNLVELRGEVVMLAGKLQREGEVPSAVLKAATGEDGQEGGEAGDGGEKETLSDKLAALEALAGSMRADASERKARLQTLSAECVRLATCLGQEEELGETFMDVDSLLTEQRVALFQSKRDELREMMERRKLEVALLVYDIQLLLRELDIAPETDLDRQVCSSLERNLFEEADEEDDDDEDFDDEADKTTVEDDGTTISAMAAGEGGNLNSADTSTSTVSTSNTNGNQNNKENDEEVDEEAYAELEQQQRAMYHRKGTASLDMLDAANRLTASSLGGRESSVFSTVEVASKRSQGKHQRKKSSGEVPPLRSEEATEQCVGTHIMLIEILSLRARELSDLRKDRLRALEELGERIAALWEQLQVDEDGRKAFQDSLFGLSQRTIDRGNAELERLRQERLRRLDDLIAECRSRMADLWQVMEVADADKNGFDTPAPSVAGRPPEEGERVLQEHEEELQRLERRMDSLRPVLTFVQRREQTLREREELESLAKDSSRLSTRGAQLTEQLRKEEKMTRRVQGLPKLTAALLRRIADWEGQAKEPFMYQGERYTERITRQEDEWRAHREAQKAGRRQREQREARERHNSGGQGLSFSLRHGGGGAGGGMNHTS